MSSIYSKKSTCRGNCSNKAPTTNQSWFEEVFFLMSTINDIASVLFSWFKSLWFYDYFIPCILRMKWTLSFVLWRYGHPLNKEVEVRAVSFLHRKHVLTESLLQSLLLELIKYIDRILLWEPFLILYFKNMELKVLVQWAIYYWNCIRWKWKL